MTDLDGRAPSRDGAPREFKKLQSRKDGAMFAFYGPPSAVGSIPITLLDRVFGQFVHDRQNYTPTREDHQLVWKLSREMSDFHEKESDRMIKFRKSLAEYGIVLSASELEDGSGCKTDGDMRWKGLCYVVVEGKNLLGGGGVADAVFEALLYYLLSTRRDAVKHWRGRFPGLIMYLCGV
jgi:hypothetical protein